MHVWISGQLYDTALAVLLGVTYVISGDDGGIDLFAIYSAPPLWFAVISSEDGWRGTHPLDPEEAAELLALP